jgi:2-methylcitrate dehydratase PrpD
MSDDITRRLVRYVISSRYDDIPGKVRHEAVRSFFNWTGVTVAGAHHETVEAAIRALKPLSGPAQAGILGRTERFDILNASLLNGMASAVLDFDSTQYKRTNIHPSGPVMPAVLALAETRPISGADFMHAYLLGIEVECRLANNVFGGANSGWHVTGVVGTIGAAAAAGKLLGLDEEQLTFAFGIAATQPGGLREMYGTMCKSFTPGRACQNGLTAALLAASGFKSSDRSIEAPLGLAKVMAGVTELEGVVADFGTAFEVSTNIHKPFACAIVLHPIVDGCIRLRNAHGFAPEDVDRVELTVNPNVLVLAGRTDPKNGLEGKFSYGHATALALTYLTAGEPQFQDAQIHDPALIYLRNRVSAKEQADIRKNEAHLIIHLKDGRILQEHVEYALGCLENPMSDADLGGKFKSLTESILPAAQVTELMDLLWSVEGLDDAGAIARTAVSKLAATG